MLGCHAIVYIDPRTEERWIYPIPEEYLEKSNILLIVEHPNYILEIDGSNRIVHNVQLDLIEKLKAEIILF